MEFEYPQEENTLQRCSGKDKIDKESCIHTCVAEGQNDENGSDVSQKHHTSGYDGFVQINPSLQQLMHKPNTENISCFQS